MPDPLRYRFVVRPKCHALAVELTTSCNQKCSYCYNAWRADGGASLETLPGTELVALLDRALTEIELHHVTLTGGEPLAAAELFDFIEVCRSHGVAFQVISNGTLVTDALAARLAARGPRFVQVSLNGPDNELHDAHAGRGFFAAAVGGIEALVRHGIDVAGCTVVTRKNAAAVGEILDRFRALGVERVALSRFAPAGDAVRHVAELLPSRTDMLGALEQAERRGREHGMVVKVTTPMPQCVVEHADYPHVGFGTCAIGTGMQEFVLGPAGELRNCTLYGEVIGDARSRSFAELVEAPAVKRYRDVVPAFCDPCPLKQRCIGGCGAAAAWTLGEVRGLDPLVAQHVDDGFRARLRTARAQEPDPGAQGGRTP